MVRGRVWAEQCRWGVLWDQGLQFGGTTRAEGTGRGSSLPHYKGFTPRLVGEWVCRRWVRP